mmetsp:Transcript_52391/g.113525  ORF Transcript_52391/g.113525 Transcript_52391/m.113525 type:complete len:440 (+) Transcript_52391:102-1421(+)|eukprot:CAMPEP_0170603340 /NCGR_PEP_ID=MMETSP0224-20130122/18861_1 /TAXON_ID=285029 /ORGANISM="Togula jolla, Strain CCCM 725" /LENGTH=439 /DNA_ID=CAMNT_0010928217 /DNA_START=90 /DNA_END=1409 /DNA_ORIENTATION=-
MASNMPKDVEARIRALPGNNICADCSNVNPQWASVSYGSLVCLECSGQHRSLGVHLSFVRSVAMDSWSAKQIAAMERSGGNAKLVDYLKSRGIDKSVLIATKYNTKQAEYYRNRLARWLEGQTEPPPDPGNWDPVSGGDAQGAEPLPGESTDEYNARQARLREAARERLRQKFGQGGLGGVGSDLGQSRDGIDFGSLGGKAVGLVGGAVCGVGSFVRNNVIESGAVGGVGQVAGDALNSFRQSVSEGTVLDKIRYNATAQEGSAVRTISGSVLGAVGGFLGKASESMGGVSGSDGTPGASYRGAPPGEDDEAFFASIGGSKRNEGSTRGSQGGTPGRSISKPDLNFKNDDDWGDWGDDVKAPNKEPSKEDIGRIANDLGMKLPVPKATAGADSAPPPRPKADPSPAASPAAASSASSPSKKKGPVKLQSSDDFFGEFGV